jgi:hypothetical protein
MPDCCCWTAKEKEPVANGTTAPTGSDCVLETAALVE